MFTKIFTSRLLKRFTHNKPAFPEKNTRFDEDLIHTQNRNLRKISDQISGLGNCIILLTVVIAFKPIS